MNFNVRVFEMEHDVVIQIKILYISKKLLFWLFILNDYKLMWTLLMFIALADSNKVSEKNLTLSDSKVFYLTAFTTFKFIFALLIRSSSFEFIISEVYKIFIKKYVFFRGDVVFSQYFLYFLVFYQSLIVLPIDEICWSFMVYSASEFCTMQNIFDSSEKYFFALATDKHLNRQFLYCLIHTVNPKLKVLRKHLSNIVKLVTFFQDELLLQSLKYTMPFVVKIFVFFHFLCYGLEAHCLDLFNLEWF